MLRYNIGVDYGNYVHLYVNNFTVARQIEPGFELIGLFCKAIDMPPWLFMGFISGITYGLICFVIPRQYIFTVILFYILSYNYLYSYNIVRQSLASSFLFCGFSYYYHDKKLNGWIYFIIAVLIHYSSLIVLPLIIISHIKINKIIRIAMILIVSIMFIFTDISYHVINIGTLISPRYAYLFVLLAQRQKAINTGLSFVFYALPSMLLLLNSENIAKQSNGNLILNINAVYIITIALSFITAAFARFYGVLTFSSLFSIQILYDSNKKYRIINHYLLLVAFLAIFIRYMTGVRDGPGIIPYNSIFNR
jgi:hypothetical protein